MGEQRVQTPRRISGADDDCKADTGLSGTGMRVKRIEVSDGMLRFDREVASLHARHRIAEVWLRALAEAAIDVASLSRWRGRPS